MWVFNLQKICYDCIFVWSANLKGQYVIISSYHVFENKELVDHFLVHLEVIVNLFNNIKNDMFFSPSLNLLILKMSNVVWPSTKLFCLSIWKRKRLTCQFRLSFRFSISCNALSLLVDDFMPQLKAFHLFRKRYGCERLALVWLYGQFWRDGNRKCFSAKGEMAE